MILLPSFFFPPSLSLLLLLLCACWAGQSVVGLRQRKDKTRRGMENRTEEGKNGSSFSKWAHGMTKKGDYIADRIKMERKQAGDSLSCPLSWLPSPILPVTPPLRQSPVFHLQLVEQFVLSLPATFALRATSVSPEGEEEGRSQPLLFYLLTHRAQRERQREKDRERGAWGGSCLMTYTYKLPKLPCHSLITPPPPPRLL